jgi:hypothetical protein
MDVGGYNGKPDSLVGERSGDQEKILSGRKGGRGVKNETSKI